MNGLICLKHSGVEAEWLSHKSEALRRVFWPEFHSEGFCPFFHRMNRCRWLAVLSIGIQVKPNGLKEEVAHICTLLLEEIDGSLIVFEFLIDLSANFSSKNI